MRLLTCRAVVRSFRRRSARVALLVAYAITAAGIPLPAGTVAQKSGELYPCSDCACGCASAEQCWRSCCCHSMAERMAWARVHGVRPPEFAIAEARAARIDLAWLVEPTGAGAKSLCCARELMADAPACCHAKKACCCDHHEQQSSESKSNRVIGWKALNCQGHSSNWLAAVPSLVSVNCVQSDELPLIQWLGPAVSEHADRAGDLPAIPPPQTVFIFAV
jgi:hypothetical protein